MERRKSWRRKESRYQVSQDGGWEENLELSGLTPFLPLSMCHSHESPIGTRGKTSVDKDTKGSPVMTGDYQWKVRRYSMGATRLQKFNLGPLQWEEATGLLLKSESL